MATEHVDIQDPQIHEPKGILAAGNGEVYVADGVGSGAMGNLPSGNIDTAGSSSGQRFISDGVGGGVFKHGSDIHGEMYITNYSTALVLAAATDPTLNTDSDYVKVTGTGMWQGGHLDGVTFNTDKLIAPYAGTYEITFWGSADISATGTLVGLKYAIQDTAPYSIRKILGNSKATTDINNMFGTAFIDLLAGQSISMYIASDGITNVTLREAGMLMKLLEVA